MDLTQKVEGILNNYIRGVCSRRLERATAAHSSFGDGGCRCSCPRLIQYTGPDTATPQSDSLSLHRLLHARGDLESRYCTSRCTVRHTLHRCRSDEREQTTLLYAL